MNTREAIVLTAISALKADKKIKMKELKTISALMTLNPLYESIVNYRNYTIKLSNQYAESETDLIIDEVSECLSPKMRETAYAWACAIVMADAGAGQEEHAFLKLLMKKFKINGSLAGKISAVASMFGRKE